MIFFRQGEITDDKERENLQAYQESGDEYQKGLALCVLSGIFLVIGFVLFVFDGIYVSIGKVDAARSLQTGGVLMCGIGTVLGLPGVAFILLYRKDQKRRSTYAATTMPIVSSLAQDVNDVETARLLKSAHKVVKRLGQSSIESTASIKQETQTKSLKLGTEQTQWTSEDNSTKPKSFADFGRMEGLSDFDLYRQKLLENYIEKMIPKTELNQLINTTTSKHGEPEQVQSEQEMVSPYDDAEKVKRSIPELQEIVHLAVSRKSREMKRLDLVKQSIETFKQLNNQVRRQSLRSEDVELNVTAPIEDVEKETLECLVNDPLEVTPSVNSVRSGSRSRRGSADYETGVLTDYSTPIVSFNKIESATDNQGKSATGGHYKSFNSVQSQKSRKSLQCKPSSLNQSKPNIHNKLSTDSNPSMHSKTRTDSKPSADLSKNEHFL